MIFSLPNPPLAPVGPSIRSRLPIFLSPLSLFTFVRGTTSCPLAWPRLCLPRVGNESCYRDQRNNPRLPPPGTAPSSITDTTFRSRLDGRIMNAALPITRLFLLRGSEASTTRTRPGNGDDRKTPTKRNARHRETPRDFGSGVERDEGDIAVNS